MDVRFPMRWVRSAVVAVGSLLVILGLLVMAGWVAESSRVVQIVRGFVPMQFNTALSFAIGGSALLAKEFGHKRVALAAGGLMAVIGVLTLIEYGFRIDLRIDQLFVVPHITDRTPFPGRMAGSTALAFVLSGTALMIASRQSATRRTAFLTALCASGVLALGVLSAFGYLSHTEAAYDWAGLSGMALHTTFAFMLLGSVLLLVAWRRGYVEAGDLPRWLGIPVGATAAMVTLGLWLALGEGEQRTLARIASDEEEHLAGTIAETLEHHAQTLARFGELWEERGRPRGAAWMTEGWLFHTHGGPSALAWLDGQRHLSWIATLDPQWRMPGAFPLDSRRQLAMAHAIEQGRAAFTTAGAGENGEFGFEGYAPLSAGGRPDGFLIGVYRVAPLIDSLLPVREAETYAMTLYEENVPIYRHPPNHAPLSLEKPGGEVPLAGLHWTVHIRPFPGRWSLVDQALPEAVLAGGMALALLVWALIHVASIAWRKARDAEQSARGLRQEIIERRGAEEGLRLAQNELENSVRRYRALLESAPDAIVTIDQEGIVETFNQAAERLFGFSSAEVVGRTVRLLMPSPHRERHDEYLRRYLATGERRIIGFNREVEGQRKDGSRFPLSLSVCEVSLGERRCFTGIARDLSAQKQAEAELRQAHEELVRRERLSVLGQLTATVSHELRNPLGVIQSSAFYLQRVIRAPEEKVAKHLKRITDQVDLCTTIVADLLEYTRGRPPELAPCDFNLWLNQLLNEIEPHPGVALERALAAEAPLVSIDAAKMRQVVNNLVENGMQAVSDRRERRTGGGEDYRPRVIVRTEGGDHQLCLIVEDNGVGMETEIARRALDPLFTTRARGTGLGLAIVSKVVKEHGGELTFQTEPGVGTRFTVSLPRGEARAHPRELSARPEEAR